LLERLAGCVIKALDLFGGKIFRQRDRRQLRAVQDFIRIGIADAGEQAWIRQCSFEGMVFTQQFFPECIHVRIENLYPARIHRAKRSPALHEVQRGAALGACLGERERAVLEPEERQGVAAFLPFVLALPVQSPGDHEVQH